MQQAPPSDWKINMMLADHAQAVQGKLYISGGGWSVIGPQMTPIAVAAKIDIPWDQANQQHTLRLELLDGDGNVIQLPGPAGAQPFVMDAKFESGRPPGLKKGTPLDMAFAVNIGPLPLEPGKRYVMRLSILATPVSVSCPFFVRESLPQA